MGAGEQKVVRLVQELERLPARSLILLEEPELTLHPDAQRDPQQTQSGSASQTPDQ
jgi:predicted ATP-dependent endonuclease of OLD family